jgi:glycosyltransferase involved in cell wall biosynthesis
MTNSIVTVYTLAYNEELMMPYFIKHYRAMFPGCKIVVYDNQSTDETVNIALANNCEVRTYDTDGKLSDKTYLDIKNNAWKTADTEWVLIADVDEHCVLNEQDVKREVGTSIFRFKGYNFVNHKDNLDIDSITHFVRAESYDKYYLFNRKKIKEINYWPGCHKASPAGNVAFSRVTYPVRHYKYINPDYMVQRHAMFAARLSDDNKQKGYGGHYQYSEETIRKEFADAIKLSSK